MQNKRTKYFVGGFEFRFTGSFVVIVLLDYLNTKKVFVGKDTSGRIERILTPNI
jgi:hypothetical protein